MGLQTFMAKGHSGYCGLVSNPHVKKITVIDIYTNYKCGRGPQTARQPQVGYPWGRPLWRYTPVGGACNSIRQQPAPKRWHLLTTLHGVTSLKTRMFQQHQRVTFKSAILWKNIALHRKRCIWFQIERAYLCKYTVSYAIMYREQQIKICNLVTHLKRW
jgi:hypothetical protein